MQLYSGLAYSTSAKLIIEFVQCIVFFFIELCIWCDMSVTYH